MIIYNFVQNQLFLMQCYMLICVYLLFIYFSGKLVTFLSKTGNSFYLQF